MNAHEQALRPSDLATIDIGKLAILNSVYSSDGARFGQHVWRWRETRSAAIDHWVRLECGQQQLWLGIIAATIDEDIDFCWRDFDGSAQRIAWCVSYPQILELTQQIFQADWVPVDIRADLDEAVDLIDAGFVVDHAGHRMAAGRCRFSAECPPASLGSPDSVPTTIFRQLPLAIPIVVDRTMLTVNELRKLEIGAVVRVNRRAFLDIGAELRLSVGGNDIVVVVTGTKLTVVAIETRSDVAEINMEREMTTNESQVSQDNDAPGSSDELATAPIDVASMPVEVRFEAGRMLTRYDELCRIQPGYTYELGYALGEHTIDITANGALIARGELVSVGNQLGVRITALGRDPHAIG